MTSPAPVRSAAVRAAAASGGQSRSHVVYFGGDSEFELWLRDDGSLGRYRRSGAVSGSGRGSGAGMDSSSRSGT